MQEENGIITNQGADFVTRLALAAAGDDKNELKAVLNTRFGAGNWGKVKEEGHPLQGHIVWRSPQEEGRAPVGGWKLVDEKAFTKGDVAQAIPPVIRGTMEGLGGTAGFATGGGVIGGMGGAAAGRMGYENLKDAFLYNKTVGIGAEDPRSGIQRMGDTALAGGESALYEAGPSIAQKAMAPNRFGVTPKMQELYGRMKEKGMTATPASIGGGTGARMAEGALSAMPFSAGRMQQTYEGNLKRLGDLAEEVIGVVGKPSAGREEAGKIAREAARKNFDTFRSSAEMKFNTIGKIGEQYNVQVPMDDAVNLLGQQTKTTMYQKDPTFRKFVDTALDTLTDKETGKALSFPIGADPADGARAVRRVLERFADSPDVSKDISEGLAGRVSGMIRDGMAKAFEEQAGPVWGDLYKKTNAWYAAQKNLWNSNLGKKVSKEFLEKGLAPERFVDLLKPKNLSEMRELKRIVGDDAFDYLKNQYIADQFTKSKLTVSPKGRMYFDTVDPGGFWKSFIQKWEGDTEAFNFLFNARERRAIYDWAELAMTQTEAAKSVSTMERSSQATLAGKMGLMGQINNAARIAVLGGAGAAAYFGPGGMIQKAAQGAAVLSAPWLASLLVTSRPGMAWYLSKGQGAELMTGLLRTPYHIYFGGSREDRKAITGAVKKQEMDF